MKEKLRKIINITKEHFILILGTGLFVYNLFDFSRGRYCDSSGPLPSFGCDHSAVYYYYENITLIWLTLGAIFIVIGLISLKRGSER